MGRAAPTPPPPAAESGAPGGRNKADLGAGGPGRRGGRRCCAAAGDPRAGPGRADLGGTPRAPAGAQAALCPPPLGSRGPRSPTAVASPRALGPFPRLACPHLLRSSRSAARPPHTPASERPISRLPAAGGPRFPGEEAREGREGGGGGRHVTPLATFHHSHQIDNFCVPRPQPRRCSQPVRAHPRPRQIRPPPRTSRKLPSLPGTTECSTPSRRAKDRRSQPDEQGPGGGQLSLNGRQGCSGAEAGAGPRAPAGRLPAIVYTGCAPRRTRAGRGRGGGGGCVLALAWPGPRATFVVSRGCSPPLREDFFFSSSKERKKEAPHGFAYLFFAKTHNRNFFPAAQM